MIRNHLPPPMLGLSTMVNELGIIIRVIDPTDRTGSEVIMNHYFGLGHQVTASYITSCTCMDSAVLPLLLICGERKFAAVRSKLALAAGAAVGIIKNPVVPIIRYPVQNNVPVVPMLRQRTVISMRQLLLVWLAVSAPVQAAFTAVPLASIPVPHIKLKVKLPGVAPVVILPCRVIRIALPTQEK